MNELIEWLRLFWLRLFARVRGLPGQPTFYGYAEQWAVCRIGGQQAAGVAGSIATFSAVVDDWSTLCRRFGRIEVASSEDLDWLLSKLTGFGSDVPEEAVRTLVPDAMRVLFQLAPGPREREEGKLLPVLDTVCQAPAGFGRMSAFSSERLHQLGLWIASPDGPRAVHLLSGTRGAGKSEFIKGLREGYLDRARSIQGKPYWPLCTKISISPALVTGRDVVGALLSQLIKDASSNYWDSMGSWGWCARPVIAFNGMVLALARFSHQNIRLLKLVGGISLLVLLVVGFFLGLNAHSPIESSAALIWLPVHLPVDQLSIFATVLTLLSSIGLMGIGYAYQFRSPLKSSDVEASGPDAQRMEAGRRLFARGMVALVGLPLLIWAIYRSRLLAGPTGVEPMTTHAGSSDTRLFVLGLALVLIQALMYGFRLWTRRAKGATGTVSAVPNGAYRELALVDVTRVFDELIPALIGVTLLALLAFLPTSEWAGVTPFGFFTGAFASFHLVAALFLLLFLWALMLPADRYLLNAIEVSAGNLAEESQQAKREIPSPVWAWASKLLPSFGKIDSTQHADARAQEALVQICAYSALLYERVIVLVDDVDILASETYPEVLRALRPLIKAGPGVVAVVSVPPSFHHALRIGLMNDVHSTARDEILLAPRFIFDTVERVHLSNRERAGPGQEIYALRPGCVLVNGKWKALASQLAIRPELVDAKLWPEQRVILLELVGELLRVSARLPTAPGSLDLKQPSNFVAQYWRDRIDQAIHQLPIPIGMPVALLRKMGPSIREWKRWLELLMGREAILPVAPVGTDDLLQACSGVVDSVHELALAMESALWFESLSEDILIRKSVSEFASYIREAERSEG